MVAENLLNTVLSLPIEERLELYGWLGESLQDHPLVQAPSEEEKRLLDERAEDILQNANDESSWEDVEARLNAVLKERHEATACRGSTT